MDGALASLVAFDGGLTLLPPLVAIALAWMTKRVIPSLLTAAVVGALIAEQLDPIASTVSLLGFMRAAVIDVDHFVISAFSLLVAAMVGVMGMSGGTRALIAQVERVAQGPRGAMVSTWLAGAVVFFDDYANCLVVGSAMGPMCDRHGVSRAKLAYIVDATAAPLASLALVSTWIGFEVGLIGEALQKSGSELEGFPVFLAALPFRFYCIYTLAFVGAVALLGRDFGPMLEAELAARRAKRAVAQPSEQSSASPLLAAVPVVVLVGLTFTLLVTSGRANLGVEASGAALFEILGAADAFWSMLYGAAAAWVTSVLLALGARRLSPGQALQSSWRGGSAVFKALIVLYLAWTLGDVIKATGAGDYIAGALEGRMSPWMLPLVTFVLAAGTAFSTGSSFFTMATLIPLVVPLALTLGGEVAGPVLLASTAAVLDGAVLGDHASPISDTTILSAIGSQVEVVTHVRTQLPYALACGAVAVALGALPAGLGVTPWLLLPAGVLGCIAVVRIAGKPVPRGVSLGSDA